MAELSIFLKKQKGFGLLGVIIAIFIVSFGLVGILSLSSYSLRAFSTSENEIIASGLGQEGIEMVRAMRNESTNWTNWYASIINGNYLVQYNKNSLMPFIETPLKFNLTTGLYQYDSGASSIYYRRVILTKAPGGSADELRVVAEIKWQDRGVWHYLIVEDRLWKWQF